MGLPGSELRLYLPRTPKGASWSTTGEQRLDVGAVDCQVG